MAFLFYGSIIASMVLYANTISIMKKIKDDQDISGNKSLGVLLVGFIVFSVLQILIA